MADKEGAAPLMLKKKSRSSRFASWTGDANRLRDKIFRSLYIFLLIAIDFVMFIYSINGRLFEGGSFNQAIGTILGSVLAVSFAIIFCLSFSRTLQNVVCAVVTVLMTVIFFNQFALFDVGNFVETWLKGVANWLTFICIIPSSWIIGLLLGIIIFFAFRYSDAILFITLVLLFSGVIGVQKNEMIKKSPNEYTEVKSLAGAGSGGKSQSNIVYLMAPKLPSYQFLNSTGDLAFRDLRDLLLGFYAVNKFEIYPNAFVQNSDAMENLIDIFNQVDYTSSTSGNRGYAEYLNKWDFVHGSLEKLSLEDNQLFDYLKKNGYGVSMYAMPQFDFCLKGGEFSTNRCVVKGYKTVSLIDKNTTTERNVYALLGEWILSIKNRDLNSLGKMFLNMSSLKGYRVLSENRRVAIEGADQLLDRLSSDFTHDKGDQAYLAYVDLPSDIFIYDEFCNIKPRKNWVALKDNTVYAGKLDEKKQAYIEQTKCLIGKLQEYMDEVVQQKKIDNTNIFIQGISPIRELAPRTTDKYNQFVADKLVNLAVRRGDNPRFLINANICLASDFTKSLMRYQDYCYTLDDMKMKKDEVFSLKKNLINNAVIRSNRISNIVESYRAWYENYKLKNSSYQKKMAQEKKETLARQKRQEAIALHDKEIATKNEEIRSSADNIFELTDDMIESPKESMPEDEFKNDIVSDDESSAPVLLQPEVKESSPLVDIPSEAMPVVEKTQAVVDESVKEETVEEEAVKETPNAEVTKEEISAPVIEEQPSEIVTDTSEKAPVKETDNVVQEAEEAVIEADQNSEAAPVEPVKEIVQEVTETVQETTEQAVAESNEVGAESIETVNEAVEQAAENAALPEISAEVMPVATSAETETKAEEASDNSAKDKVATLDKADELDLF